MRKQPNILLFLTDDHGPWALGCYGNSEIYSPAMDMLAAEGVRFANAFTPSPVCSPARACLLTGRTPSQVGIHDWIQDAVPEFGNRDWLADSSTLPMLLSAAGYHCGLSGKWHLGRVDQKPAGFAWYFGLPGWQGAHIETYTYVHNNTKVTLSGNKSHIIADHALQFLDSVPTDQPWFLQIGFIATHSPYTGQSPELVNRYRDATFRDIPPYVPHPWHKNEDFAQGDQYSDEDCVQRYRNYYAAVTDMDMQMEHLLSVLRAKGELDNTLVMYTSDHGLALGHQGFWGKGNSTRPLNMYDISTRVPLLLHWPAGGLTGGRVVPEFVDHYDTFQVLCEIAGVTLDAALCYPGRSYMPLARGNVLQDWRDTRFGEYGDLRMIRTPAYKYVRRYPAGPNDLFDLAADPGEKTNLAEQPSMSAIEAALKYELESWYATHEVTEHSGLRVKMLPQHNRHEAWRDSLREARGLQVYGQEQPAQ